MAKRAVGLYRLISIRPDDRRPADVQGLIDIAGRLPATTFTVSLPEPADDGERCITLSARDYLSNRVQKAIQEYDWNRQEAHRPTPTQLAREYATIGTAARRLLHALRNDIDKMPYALRYGGLSAAAAVDATDRQIETSGDVLLRTAMQGVEDIRRWSDIARSREEAARIMATSGRPPEKRGKPPKRASRNKGDQALNGFIRRVVEDCWCGIWDFPVTDSEKLWNFTGAIAALVGIRLKAEASRGRVRVIFADILKARAMAKLQER